MQPGGERLSSAEQSGLQEEATLECWMKKSWCPGQKGRGLCSRTPPPTPKPRKKHHLRVCPFGSHTHILSRTRHQEAVLSLFAPNSVHTLSPHPPTHLRVSDGVV